MFPYPWWVVLASQDSQSMYPLGLNLKIIFKLSALFNTIIHIQTHNYITKKVSYIHIIRIQIICAFSVSSQTNTITYMFISHYIH